MVLSSLEPQRGTLEWSGRGTGEGYLFPCSREERISPHCPSQKESQVPAHSLLLHGRAPVALGVGVGNAWISIGTDGEELSRRMT